MKSLKWKFILGVAIASLFLAYFFRRANIGEIWQKSQDANIFYLLLALFFVFLSYLVRSLRWKIMLKPMGEVTLWSSFKITCIGFMFNNLIPRTGEIARPVLIGRKEGISISSALATVFIERVLDFLTLFSFFALFALFSTSSVVHDPGLIKMGWFLGLITFFLLVFIAALKWKASLCLRIFETILKPLPQRFHQKLLNLLQLFISGLDILGNRTSIVYLVILSFVMWIVIVALTECVILAFAPLLNLQPPPIGSYFVISTVGVLFCAIAMMVPTPGGMGSFHVMLASVLTLLGEEKVLSNSIAALTHAITWFPITITGFILLYTEGLNLSGLSKTVEQADTEIPVKKDEGKI